MASKNIFAIELDEKYINFAYVRLLRDKIHILSLESATINSLEEAVNKIQEFGKKNRISKKDQTLNVIPSHYVIPKNIEIPSIDPKEIKDIIDLQAGRHTPYSREEIIMNYVNIGVIHERYTRILLVILKKDVVTSRYDIIKKSGWKADRAVLAAEAVGLLSADLSLTDNQPTGFLLFNPVATEYIVGKKDLFLYLRSIPVNIYQDDLNLESVQENLIGELKNTLEIYTAENIDEPVKKIWLNAVNHPGLGKLKNLLEEKLSLEIEVLSLDKLSSLVRNYNAFQNNQLPVTVLGAAGYLPQLQLNLIPENVRIQKELKERAKKMTLIGILAMGLFLMICALLATNVFLKKMYLQRLLSSYNEQNQAAAYLKEVSERTQIIKKFIKERSKVIETIREVINQLPKEVYINSFSVNPDGVVKITGTADSMSLVFSLVTKLENHEKLSNVQVDFTKSRIEEGKEVADFGFTMFYGDELAIKKLQEQSPADKDNKDKEGKNNNEEVS